MYMSEALVPNGAIGLTSQVADLPSDVFILTCLVTFPAASNSVTSLKPEAATAAQVVIVL
jgi:hypothetical protein